MISFNKKELAALPRLEKINLMNSATGYKSANLIGTKSEKGIANLAIFSSVTHFGSDPAIYGFVLRPTVVPRNTYENIKETGVYTINSVSRKFLIDAHHTSAKYEASISEFEKTAFTELYRQDFYAPFVENTKIQIGMKYIEEIPVKSNNTILILGAVENIYIKKNLVEEDLFINLGKGQIAAINGLDAYAVPKLHTRLPYQRPKVE